MEIDYAPSQIGGSACTVFQQGCPQPVPGIRQGLVRIESELSVIEKRLCALSDIISGAKPEPHCGSIQPDATHAGIETRIQDADGRLVGISTKLQSIIEKFGA